MKLVFLYGPPGVGKLTVGKELEHLTGFQLLHNHLVLDEVVSRFSRESDDFKKEVKAMRLQMVRKAIDAGASGMIMTYVYIDTDIHRRFVQELKKIIESDNGSFVCIRLLCDQTELEKRVVSSDRTNHGKLQHPKKLREFLKHHDATSPIPGVESITIDTTHLTAEEAAKKIQKECIDS